MGGNKIQVCWGGFRRKTRPPPAIRKIVKRGEFIPTGKHEGPRGKGETGGKDTRGLKKKESADKKLLK